MRPRAAAQQDQHNIVVVYVSMSVCLSVGNTACTRAHHRDEKPERDLTYHLTCLLIYHGTTTHL